MHTHTHTDMVASPVWTKTNIITFWDCLIVRNCPFIWFVSFTVLIIKFYRILSRSVQADLQSFVWFVTLSYKKKNLYSVLSQWCLFVDSCHFLWYLSVASAAIAFFKLVENICLFPFSCFLPCVCNDRLPALVSFSQQQLWLDCSYHRKCIFDWWSQTKKGERKAWIQRSSFRKILWTSTYESCDLYKLLFFLFKGRENDRGIE